VQNPVQFSDLENDSLARQVAELNILRGRPYIAIWKGRCKIRRSCSYYRHSEILVDHGQTMVGPHSGAPFCSLLSAAFSGARETVLAVTYKDVEGCETPVSTRKNTRITGSGDGLPFRQNSHTEPWVTG